MKIRQKRKLEEKKKEQKKGKEVKMRYKKNIRGRGKTDEQKKTRNE